MTQTIRSGNTNNSHSVTKISCELLDKLYLNFQKAISEYMYTLKKSIWAVAHFRDLFT